MTSRQFVRQPVASMPPSASTVIQRRPLAVNKPGDRFEREAERVAAAVMSGRAAPFTLSAVPITRVQREEAPKEKSDADKLKEAGGKLKDAFLETPLGKDLVEKVKQDKLVTGATEAGKSFIGTLPGKIITGAAAAGAVATLAATHKELPAQIPEIPLDVLTPGLSVEITYKGPVDKPTEAMITFKYSEQAPKGSADKKPAATASEKFRAETARIAADQAKFRAGLKYPPGSPEDLQQKAEEAAVKSVAAKYAGGPDVDAIIKKYQGLGIAQPKGGLQLSDPALTFGYKPSTLLGDEYKFKLPGEQKKKDDEPVLQRQASSDAAVDASPPVVNDVLQSPGQPLDAATRAFMEPRFGHDFGQVRVHTDARAAESARAVNASAYTVGRDIVFASGHFAPGTQAGRHLLAHELTHVVQQAPGVAPAPSLMQRAPDETLWFQDPKIAGDASQPERKQVFVESQLSQAGDVNVRFAYPKSELVAAGYQSKPSVTVENAKGKVLAAVGGIYKDLGTYTFSSDAEEKRIATERARLGQAFKGYTAAKPLNVFIATIDSPAELASGNYFPTTDSVFINAKDVGDKSKLEAAIRLPGQYLMGGVAASSATRTAGASPDDLKRATLHESLHALLIRQAVDSTTVLNTSKGQLKATVSAAVQDKFDKLIRGYILAQEEIFVYDSVALLYPPVEQQKAAYDIFVSGAERLFKMKGGTLQTVTKSIKVDEKVAKKDVTWSIAYKLPIAVTLADTDAQLLDLAQTTWPIK
jgi:hypothetical protein